MTRNALPDSTLGGYFEKHGRPPAFGGVDGAMYSADILMADREYDDALERAYAGALIFVQWSEDGAMPIRHLETEYLVQADDRLEVRNHLGALTLEQVKEHLDRLIAARQELPDW